MRRHSPRNNAAVGYRPALRVAQDAGRAVGRPHLAALEERRLLSVTLDNGLGSNDPAYFAVHLDRGGATRDTSLAGVDTVYDYFPYLDTGAYGVFNLRDHATSPARQGSGTATSRATISLPNGGSIRVDVTSRIPQGSRSLLNTYEFTATNYDLRDARFLQYLDADIYAVGDDVLTVSGSVATDDLVLTTVDPATMIRQAQMPGDIASGAVLSGFAADEYSQLRTLITNGGYDPPASGDIDTQSLRPRTFDDIGPGYGPEDITTAISYEFTARSEATLSTTLGLRELEMRRPILVVPGILGSMPTLGTLGQFIMQPGHHPTNLVADPILETYDPLVSTLRDTLGYREGSDLYVATYDWRLPIAPEGSYDTQSGAYDGVLSISDAVFSDGVFGSAVEYIDYWVREARQEWIHQHDGSAAGFEIDVVGHSMGGLAVRAYMQSDYYQRNADVRDSIRNVVTLGTPHEGSTNALLMVELTRALDAGAALEDVSVIMHAMRDPTSAVVAGVIDLMATMSGESTAVEYCPSVFDLFPTYDYASALLPWVDLPDDATYVNHFLHDLNAVPSRFANAATGDVHLFASGDVETASHVTYLTSSTFLVSHESGDGTVLYDSARLHGRVPGAEVHRVMDEVGHSALPGDVGVQREVIREGLELDVPDNFEPLPPTSMLVRILEGLDAPSFIIGLVDPVDFMLTDQSGRQFGYTQADGYVNEIDGAYHSGDSDYEFFIVPADEGTGDVSMQYVGVGDAYAAEIAYFSDGEVTMQSDAGHLDVGETEESDLNEPSSGNAAEGPSLVREYRNGSAVVAVFDPTGRIAENSDLIDVVWHHRRPDRIKRIILRENVGGYGIVIQGVSKVNQIKDKRVRGRRNVAADLGFIASQDGLVKKINLKSGLSAPDLNGLTFEGSNWQWSLDADLDGDGDTDDRTAVYLPNGWLRKLKLRGPRIGELVTRGY